MVAPSKIENVAKKQFDYVIIGGGTTGCTLAARLSENPDVSVLLLEAGRMHIDDPFIDMPTGFPRQFGKPEYDWAFRTVPQKNLNGKTVVWNRGKGLGGSSNLNYLAWTHPGKDEIDAWERLGNPGWSFEEFMPYIKKAEKLHPTPKDIVTREMLTVEPSWYGDKGPVSISFSDMLSGAEPIVRKTLENRGIATSKDPANGKYSGTWCSPASVNPETLTRSTAFRSYLLPNMGRKNLSVLTGAYVTRLVLGSDIIEPISAEGVQFKHENEIYTVKATKEVLLCAGALKSPQILELSGIGDPNVLTPLGIDVKLNLPGVGANMQEHFSNISLAFELKSDANIQTLDILSDPIEFQKFSELYQQRRRGLLSLTVSGLTFTSLQAMSPEANSIITKVENKLATQPPNIADIIRLERLKDPQIPDVEIITNPIFSGNINRAEPGKRYISFILGMVTPWSRGTAHITSTDPLQNPAFDANYLAEEVDLDIMTETFKFARSLADYEPFKNVIVKEANPGPTIQTEEEVKAHIKQNLNTLWHTLSTLSMLPREAGGVVDTSLKIWGTKNIRVCDVSIIPLQVGGHTQCIAYGIAEKAAEMILGRA